MRENLFLELFNQNIKNKGEENKAHQWSSFFSTIEKLYSKNFIFFTENDMSTFFNNSLKENTTESEILNTHSIFCLFKSTVRDYYRKGNEKSKIFDNYVRNFQAELDFKIDENELSNIYDREWLINLNQKLYNINELAIVNSIYEGVGGSSDADLSYEELQYLGNDSLHDNNILSIYRNSIKDSEYNTRLIMIPDTTYVLLEQAKTDLTYYRGNDPSKLSYKTIKESDFLIKHTKRNTMISYFNLNSIILNRIKKYLGNENTICQTILQKSGIFDYLGLIEYYNSQINIEHVRKVLYRYGLDFSTENGRRYLKLYEKVRYYKENLFKKNSSYYSLNIYKKIYEHILSYNLPDENIYRITRGKYNNFSELEGYSEEYKNTYKAHIQIERDNKLIRKIKKDFLQKYGHFFCEICKLKYSDTYGEIGEDYIEIHHLIPLSQLKKEIDEGKDLSTIKKYQRYLLVCSNCHSMLHRFKYWKDDNNIKHIISLINNNELSIESVFKL